MDRTIPNKETVAEKVEGEARISIISQPDAVVVNFGKPMAWIGLRPQEAVNFAALIIKHASEVAARTGEELSLTLDAGIALSGMLPGEKPL